MNYLKSYFRIKFILSNLNNYEHLDKITSFERNIDEKDGYKMQTKRIGKREMKNLILHPNRNKFVSVINASKRLNNEIVDKTKIEWKWPRFILIQSNLECSQIEFQSEVDHIINQLYRKPRPEDKEIKKVIKQSAALYKNKMK